MKNFIIKLRGLFKIHKKKSIVGIVLLLVIGWFSFGSGDGEILKTNAAETGSVIQEVSISGRVVSSQAVDLSFEQSGKVAYVALKSGQQVRAYGLIAQLNAADAQKNLRDSELNLENAKIVLAKMKLGQDTDIPKLQDAITTAQNNLDQAHQKGFNEVADAFLDMPDILTGIWDLLMDVRIEPGDPTFSSYQNKVEFSSYKSANEAYDSNFSSYNTSTRQSDPAVIETLINETLETAKKLAQTVKDEQNILDLVADEIEEVSTSSTVPQIITDYQADIAVYIGQLNGHITSLTNTANSITSNKQVLASAKRSLDTAYQSNPLDIASQENVVKQRESAVLDAHENLAKYSIRAPFAGIVANIDIKAGQFITPQTSVVSIIGNAKFQIETNISEADIAKIKLGDEAAVTLDAYGKDQKLKAGVVHIDPAGQVTNSVATYKVTLEFSENDPRLLSGLTADIDIQTNKKDNVVYVTSRDIITKDDKKFVRILVTAEEAKKLANVSVVSSTKEGKVIEVEVETGLRGSDGRTEIVSGIKAEDKIVSK